MTAYTMVTNFTILALGLVNSIILARLLGPAGRGELAAALLWPMMLVYLGSLGLGPATLYFVARPEARLRVIFYNAMIMALIQGIVVMLIGYVAMPWLLASQSDMVVAASRLFLWVIPISLVTQYSMSILQGRLHITIFNLLRLVLPAGYLSGVIIYTMLEQLTLLNILRLQLALNLATLLGALLALLRFCHLRGFQLGLTEGKQMLQYGIKVQLGTVSQLANLRLDQSLMSTLMPAAQLGLYVTAVSSADLGLVLSGTVKLLVTPTVAQKATPDERTRFLLLTFRKYWILSILSALALALVLPIAIPLVFGIEYQASVWPAEVLLLAAVFLGAKEVLSGGAQGLGDPWLVSRSEIISLIVTVVLLLILLPTLGIMGAAVATLAAYLTSLVVIAYGLCRSHAIAPTSLFLIAWRDVQAILTDLQTLVTRVRFTGVRSN